MDTSDVLRTLIDRSGMSQREVSRRLGKAPTWASTTLGKGSDSQLGTVAAVADLAGCDVVVVDRATGETVAVVDRP